jgi:hypothetical protein
MGRDLLMPEQQERESIAVTSSGEPGSGAAQDIPMQPSSTNLATTPSGEQQRIPRWLQQAERFLRVIVRIYIGLVVCLVPWFPPLWDANPLFAGSPTVESFITRGAVRGLVSGLGLLNLWMALRDVLQGPDGGSPS